VSVHRRRKQCGLPEIWSSYGSTSPNRNLGLSRIQSPTRPPARRRCECERGRAAANSGRTSRRFSKSSVRVDNPRMTHARDTPALADGMETIEPAFPDHHEHAAAPPYPDDDVLNRRTEEECEAVRVEDLGPGDVPPSG
jgi:hypothetical protein